MKSLVKLNALPDVLDVRELMEIKGGDGGEAPKCSVVAIAVKCTGEGGIIICPVAGSGVIIQYPEPDKPAD